MHFVAMVKKGKGALESKAQMATAYPGFLSMKHEACLGVLLLLPGQDTSPLQGYTPPPPLLGSMSLVPIYTPG